MNAVLKLQGCRLTEQKVVKKKFYFIDVCNPLLHKSHTYKRSTYYKVCTFLYKDRNSHI